MPTRAGFSSRIRARRQGALARRRQTFAAITTWQIYTLEHSPGSEDAFAAYQQRSLTEIKALEARLGV